MPRTITKRQISGEAVSRAYGAGGYDTAEDHPQMKPPGGLGVAVTNTFRRAKSMFDALAGHPDLSGIQAQIAEKKGINAGYRILKRQG